MWTNFDLKNSEKPRKWTKNPKAAQCGPRANQLTAGRTYPVLRGPHTAPAGRTVSVNEPEDLHKAVARRISVCGRIKRKRNKNRLAIVCIFSCSFFTFLHFFHFLSKKRLPCRLLLHWSLPSNPSIAIHDLFAFKCQYLSFFFFSFFCVCFQGLNWVLSVFLTSKLVIVLFFSVFNV